MGEQNIQGWEIKFDNKGQLQRVQQYLLKGETLYCVFDAKGGGTGFVGVTDVRLIFMDESFVRKSKSMVSLPYTKITAVGSEDSGGLVFKSSKLQIIAGDREWVFQFRSNDKAHYAYQVIMSNLLQTEAKGM